MCQFKYKNLVIFILYRPKFSCLLCYVRYQTDELFKFLTKQFYLQQNLLGFSVRTIREIK